MNRTFSSNFDIGDILKEYNRERAKYGLPPVTTCQLGFTPQGRAAKHDVIVGVLDAKHVRDLFVTFRLLVRRPDGELGERILRVDFRRTLSVVTFVNDQLLLLQRFRHGVGSARHNVPRGWSETNDTSAEARVKELLTRLLGAEFFSQLKDAQIDHIGDVDQDDAVRETPSDHYVFRCTADVDALPKRHKGASIRLYPFSSGVTLVRDESSMAALFQAMLKGFTP